MGRREAAGRALGGAGRPTADPGLYGPSSEAWRLNRESFLLLGAGPRALLLQLAHPLVAEGVDQHSDFRADPWQRLHATLRSYLTVVYGTTPRARAEIARLNRLHRSIAGPTRDPVARERHGPRYSGRDPHLALWVHATLVDSTLLAADRWLAPIDAARRERYYAETRPIARALGIPDAILPPTHAAFERYLEVTLEPAGPIHPSPVARRLARHVLRPPLGPVIPALGWLPPPLYAWTMWPAVGLLPDRIRREYGLAWTPVHHAVSSWLVAGFRGWNPLVPRWLRWMPRARAADARMTDADAVQ